MSKIFVIMLAAGLSLAACNEAQNDKTTVDTTADTTQNTSTTTTSTTYTPAEGDVQYSGNKVMVMRNGSWVEADADVKLDNGVTVYKNGRVQRRVQKDDYEIELRDGEVVNRRGDFFDRSGNAIENAWDATKKGAKEAGRAVKKGAKKVGEKIGDAVDGDKKDNN